jgi:Protein of unknown function (DUF1559)
MIQTNCDRRRSCSLTWQHAIVVSIGGAIMLDTGLPRSTAGDLPESRVKFISPFWGQQTFGLIYVNLAQVDVASVFRGLIQHDAVLGNFEPDADAYARLTADLRRAGANEIYFLLDLTDLPGSSPALILPLRAGADEAGLVRSLTEQAERRSLPGGISWLRGNICLKLHGALLCASQKVCYRLTALEPVSDSRLAGAFRAAGDRDAFALLLPSADMLRVADETLAIWAPDEGSSTPTTFRRGLQWAVVDSSSSGTHLKVQSVDGAGAEAFRSFMVRTLKTIGNDSTIQSLCPTWSELISKVRPVTSGDTLQLSVDSNLAVSLSRTALGRWYYHFSWPVASGLLRQIGLAFHNHLDTKGHFPAAAITDKQGKRLLSWRVAILPFLEQQDLYKEFHLDEPWDSEHNKKLIPRMPSVYASQYVLAREGKTAFLGVAGEAAMFPPHLKPLRIGDVPDGTANTVWIVMVDDAHSVPWTKPEDFNYDPKNPRFGLSDRFFRGFPVLMVDASFRVLPSRIDDKTLNALFTRNGGETIDFDRLIP